MFSKSTRGQNAATPSSSNLSREMRELSQNALQQVNAVQAGSPASQLRQTLAPTSSAPSTVAGTPVSAVPSSNSASGLPQREASVSGASSDSSAPLRNEIKGSCLMVGPAVKLKGAEILDCDTLIVEGRVEATMDSRVIQIAEKGAYSGKVSIDVAEIHGHFEGELTAREQLTIHATGHVSGKIRYGKILIEAGGQLSGDVRSLHEKTNDEAVVSSTLESQKLKLLNAMPAQQALVEAG